MALGTFLKAYLSEPKSIGAIVPSSRQLVGAMVDWIDWSRVGVVVEFGAGTGAVTRAMLEVLPPGCRMLLIERNERFVAILRRRFPRVEVIHGGVEHARRHCDLAGVGGVDVVMSTLPWASFSPARQGRCLGAAHAILHPDGVFATFTQIQSMVLPGARRIARLLPRSFHRVKRSPVVWWAMPPSVVYECHRPRSRPERLVARRAPAVSPASEPSSTANTG